jgi:GDSL-like lipase/acylhydrolase family protein
VYLPDGMKPTVRFITPVGGTIEPAPPQPRWIAYGDSIQEGWNASAPPLAWPHIVGRDNGLDVYNLGYAGAARGEIPLAEEIAELPAEVISINHGTNCWTRVPYSIGMFREGLVAFLDIIRQGHPGTPLVVASPVVRPDAESTPNRLGATLGELRRTMEEVVEDRARTDPNLQLLSGLGLIELRHLDDGIHPNDEGHRLIAAAMGAALRKVVT